MKFVKLKFPNGKNTQWRLVISTMEELAKYREFDTEAYSHAFLKSNKEPVPLAQMSTITDRASAISVMLESKRRTTPEGELIHPLIELANHIDRKSACMLKLLQYGSLCVNEVGGYCLYDDFVKTNSAIITETIDAKIGGFPSDADEPLNVETLIIENNDTVDGTFLNEICNKYNGTKVGTICRVPEVDGRYLFNCISNAKNIAMSTEALNPAQVDAFIEMFLLLPTEKKVYIETSVSGKERIQGHPKFKLLKHNIFIKTI